MTVESQYDYVICALRTSLVCIIDRFIIFFKVYLTWLNPIFTGDVPQFRFKPVIMCIFSKISLKTNL